MMAREMTPQERAAAIIGGHYDCEDPWYSCPLSPDGCANANMGKECTCGYDDRKQNVERLIAETRRAALLEACVAVSQFSSDGRPIDAQELRIALVQLLGEMAK